MGREAEGAAAQLQAELRHLRRVVTGHLNRTSRGAAAAECAVVPPVWQSAACSVRLLQLHKKSREHWNNEHRCPFWMSRARLVPAVMQYQ